ncbi:MAG: hypothetical protein AAF311_08805 [Pseudomonadota bacterium]
MSGASYVYTPVERASRRLGVLLLVVLGLTLTMMLFFVKTRAQDARAEVARLEASIAAHEAAIAVLLAERAVMTKPDRLRRLSTERLGLETIEVGSVTTVSDLVQADGEGS